MRTKAEIDAAVAQIQAERQPANRAEKRAQKKLERAMRNDAKRLKPKFRNNLAVAADRAAALTEAELTQWMTPIIQSFDLLRRGEAREDEYDRLVDAMNVSMLLTNHDIARLLPDHRDKFSAAMDALVALGVRALNNKTWTCYAAELTAIDTGIEFHSYQAQFASKAEINKAIDVLNMKNREAKAGRMAKGGIDVNDLAAERKAA